MLAKMKGAMAAGAHDAISLPRHLLGVTAIPDKLNIPRDAVTIREHQSAECFRYGLISGKAALLESFEYQPDSDTGDQAFISFLCWLHYRATQLNI